MRSLAVQRLYALACTIAVLAFIAANVCAWLAAPGQMALVTASAILVHLLSKAKEY